MRWTVIFCALMLAACGSARNTADSALSADGGVAVDGGGADACHQFTDEELYLFETAVLSAAAAVASTVDECSFDSDCMNIDIRAGCVSGCCVPINAANETAYREAETGISAEHCPAPVEGCGVPVNNVDCSCAESKCVLGHCLNCARGGCHGEVCRLDEDCGTGFACNRSTGKCEGVGMIRVDPEVLDFGCVRPGEISILQVSISNAGMGPLTVLDVKIVEPTSPDGGPSHFTLTNDVQLPSKLDPDAFITIRVEYLQDDSVEDTGEVQILSDDPGKPAIKVPIVSYRRGQPDLAIVDSTTTPPAVLFPTEGSGPVFNIDIGELAPGESKTAVLGVINTRECGPPILSLDDMTISNTGLNLFEARFASPDDPSKELQTPVYLNADELVDLVVEYAPTVPSDTDASIVTIPTNDGDIDNDGTWDDGILTIRIIGHSR
ncbi:MAG: hypothetical protein HY897_09585 [Deltaproteobacteria bacterium]|nr:hypothetical protein [Deltaproteobacteria bacterium]